MLFTSQNPRLLMDDYCLASGQLTGTFNIHQLCVDVFPDGKKGYFQVALIIYQRVLIVCIIQILLMCENPVRVTKFRYIKSPLHIPSLKLTFSHLKKDGWNTCFLLGHLPGRYYLYVSFRECIRQSWIIPCQLVQFCHPSPPGEANAASKAWVDVKLPRKKLKGFISSPFAVSLGTCFLNKYIQIIYCLYICINFIFRVILHI